MSSIPMKKQISIFLPMDDWQAIRLEAARSRIPMTELCRRWLEPALLELKQPAQREAGLETDGDDA